MFTIFIFRMYENPILFEYFNGIFFSSINYEISDLSNPRIKLQMQPKLHRVVT